MPSNKLKISDIGEKRLIKRLLSRSQKSIPNSFFFNSFFNDTSLKSLEDDAALLLIGEQFLVVTSDLLFEPAVTGVLGSAAAGFEVLSGDESLFKSLSPPDKDDILKHVLQPKARVEEGILISESESATSTTDITDGLVSEMGEILSATDQELGIRFYENKIPTSPILDEVARISGKNATEMALYYGEDFELLITISPQYFDSLKEKVEVHSIGEVTSSGRIEMIDKEGKTNILVPRGYEHLKKS